MYPLVGLELWVQPLDATHRLNRSAGVSYSSVFRGLSLSCLATWFNLIWECSFKL